MRSLESTYIGYSTSFTHLTHSLPTHSLIPLNHSHPQYYSSPRSRGDAAGVDVSRLRATIVGVGRLGIIRLVSCEKRDLNY